MRSGRKITFPRYHLNSRFRALISFNGQTRSSLLNLSGKQLRDDNLHQITLPCTNRQVSALIYCGKLPFLAFNMDKLTQKCKSVNLKIRLTQKKKSDIIIKHIILVS